MKRIIALILSVIMIIGIAPLSGFVGLKLPKWLDLIALKAEASSVVSILSPSDGEWISSKSPGQAKWTKSSSSVTISCYRYTIVKLDSSNNKIKDLIRNQIVYNTVINLYEFDFEPACRYKLWVGGYSDADGANIVDGGTSIIFYTTPEAPDVTTSSATNIKGTSATLNGTVDLNNGSNITECGFVYSTSSSNLTVNSSSCTKVKVNATGKLTDYDFSKSISGLALNTKYYYKAYATNSEGTGYGSRKYFTTTNEVTEKPGSFSISSPVQNVELEIGSVTVTWTSAFGAKGYKIALLDRTSNAKLLNNVDIGLVQSYTISKSLLTEGHSYSIAVCAYNNYGNTWYEGRYFSVIKSMSEPAILSVSLSPKTAPAGTEFTFTVTTSTDVTKLRMEDGTYIVNEWTGSEYYTDNGDVRTWTVTQIINTIGENRYLYFRAGNSKGYEDVTYRSPAFTCVDKEQKLPATTIEHPMSSGAFLQGDEQNLIWTVDGVPGNGVVPDYFIINVFKDNKLIFAERNLTAVDYLGNDDKFFYNIDGACFKEAGEYEISVTSVKEGYKYSEDKVLITISKPEVRITDPKNNASINQGEEGWLIWTYGNIAPDSFKVTVTHPYLENKVYNLTSANYGSDYAYYEDTQKYCLRISEEVFAKYGIYKLNVEAIESNTVVSSDVVTLNVNCNHKNMYQGMVCECGYAFKVQANYGTEEWKQFALLKNNNSACYYISDGKLVEIGTIYPTDILTIIGETNLNGKTYYLVKYLVSGTNQFKAGFIENSKLGKAYLRIMFPDETNGLYVGKQKQAQLFLGIEGEVLLRTYPNTVTWSVENGTGEITVTQKGLVEGIKCGTSTLKAVTQDGFVFEGVISIIEDLSITVVDGNQVAVKYATVEFYDSHDKLVRKGTTDLNGKFYFSKDDVKNATSVVAYKDTDYEGGPNREAARKPYGNVVMKRRVHSMTIDSFGTWRRNSFNGEKKKLVIDNPKYFVNLTVCYYYNSQSGDYYDDVVTAMNLVGLYLNQATDGYFEIDKVSIFGTTNQNDFYNKNKPACKADIRIEKIGKEKEDRILSDAWLKPMSNSQGKQIGAVGGIYFDDAQGSSYSRIRTSKKTKNKADLSTNPDKWAREITHECGHYILGMLDEYENIDGKSWSDIGRPQKAPENFGLMDNQYKDIEMSVPTDYDYYYKNPKREVMTEQFFYDEKSCWEWLSYLLSDLWWLPYTDIFNDLTLDEKIKIVIPTQDRFYSYSGHNVKFIDSRDKSVSTMSNDNSSDTSIFSIIEMLAAVTLKTVGEAFNIEINSFNNEAPTVLLSKYDDSGYQDLPVTENGGKYVSDSFTFGDNTISTSVIKFGTESMKVDFAKIDEPGDAEYKDNTNSIGVSASLDETDSILTAVYQNAVVRNGDYKSVAQIVSITNNGVDEIELYGKVCKHDEINFENLSWFVYSDGEWKKLNSVKSNDEGFVYRSTTWISDSGIYALMATEADDSVITIDGGNFSAIADDSVDGGVTFNISCSDEDIMGYIIYYGSSKKDVENGTSSFIVSNHAMENSRVVFDEKGTDYYISVHALYENGQRAILGETVSVTTGLYCQEGSKIPYYWIVENKLNNDEYEIVDNLDSDGDGLTNLEEYLQGTDPKNENNVKTEFTVKWIVDGEECSQILSTGDIIISPEVSQKPGYIFVGWTPAVPDVMPSYDMTFTAVFDLAFGLKIKTPSKTSIDYNDSIWLHAEIEGDLPANARIIWTPSNNNFVISEVSENGKSCKVTSKVSGTTTFTVSVVDENENVLTTATQDMTAKAGLWQKITAFFKKIFGTTKTFPELYKRLF